MRERILVVDDNPFERNLLVEAVKGIEEGLDVDTADSAEEALEKFRQRMPAVVVLDYNLPEMTGVQALQKIRGLGFDCPVILCTAEGDRDVVLEALRSGASEYLVKDSNYRQMIPLAVKKALETHRLQRERQTILERLRHSRDCFERLVVNSRDIMFQVDSRGHFLYVNPIVEDELDRSPDEFYRDPDLACSLVHPEDRERHAATWKELLERGGEASLEVRLQPGGLRTLIFAIELHTVPLGRKNGHIVQGSARNVTESRMLQRQLSRDKRQLEDANRQLQDLHRLKNEFIASVSHELRTPMNSIIGYTDCLLDGLDGPLNDEQEQSLKRVRRNAGHLLGLLNDILDLAKIEAGKMQMNYEIFDLVECVQDAVEVARPLLEKGEVQLLSELPERLLVRADGDKLRRVVLNLLSNAVKFTHTGHVKVTVKGLTAINGGVKLEVEDTGIGIKEEDVHLIFEDFRQVDGSHSRRFSGTGLGLSICRRLVDAHEGEIWVRSAYGKGTTFHVLLPVAVKEDALVEGEGWVEVAPPGGEGQRRVLVIDRQADMVGMARKVLEPEGYAVSGTGSAEEGLRLARELKPRVILVDPEIEAAPGVPVTVELRAQKETREVPLVLLALEQDPAASLALGAAGTLSKPLNMRLLVDMVKRLDGSRPRQSVLIVDEDPDVLSLYEDMLLTSGYTDIRRATTGQQVLEEVARGAPSLIITELSMPDMSGIEAIRLLRSDFRYRRIPIVVITSQELSVTDEQYLEENVRKVIRKRHLEKAMLQSGLRDILGAAGGTE